MRVGLTIFRTLVFSAWLVVMYVTIHAVLTMGTSAAGSVFIGDFAHPWRAQFNTDFSFHLLLAGAWMVYRARSWGLGLLWAICAVTLGSAFTLAYILVVSFQKRGDIRRLLLGRHAPPFLHCPNP